MWGWSHVEPHVQRTARQAPHSHLKGFGASLGSLGGLESGVRSTNAQIMWNERIHKERRRPDDLMPYCESQAGSRETRRSHDRRPSGALEYSGRLFWTEFGAFRDQPKVRSILAGAVPSQVYPKMSKTVKLDRWEAVAAQPWP